jgi:hypothetical protein
MLFIALALGAGLIYLPGQYWYTRNTVPLIHISTDTDNPPTFSAVLAARAVEHAGSVDDRGPQLAQLQKVAYPDLAPVMTAQRFQKPDPDAVATPLQWVLFQSPCIRFELREVCIAPD